MTPKQEAMFDEMHEAIIELKADTKKRVTDLEHAVYGNGKPGLKVEVPLVKLEMQQLKQKHLDCEAKRSSAEAIKPSKQSNVIAIAAILIAILSTVVTPIVTKLIGG